MRRGSVAPPGDDTAGPFGDAIAVEDAPETPAAYGLATSGQINVMRGAQVFGCTTAKTFRLGSTNHAAQE